MAILRDLCARVLAWNRTVSNLMSKNDEGRIVERHLAESLEQAQWLDESRCEEWLDFGSGAGFPAIPLAVVGVGKRWTLVESRRMKTLFLRKTLSEIDTARPIEVVNARLELFGAEGQRFGGFTARAAGKLGETLDHAGRLVSADGSAFLWKGSRWSQEMEEDRAWEREWRFIEQRQLSESNIVILKFTRRSA